MRLIRLAALFILVFLGVFTGVAFAAGAAIPEDGSVLDLIKPVIDAFRGGDYPFAASMAVVFLVAVARRYGSARIPFFATERGAAMLALIGSFAGTMAAGLSGDGEFSRHLLLTAFNVSLAATGGYMALKSFIVTPLIASKWYQDKAPAWLKSILSIVLWMFEHRGQTAAQKAEAAGNKAVAENPPKGMGEITELK